jgi:ubiquinone/menaquinone biosynthesis C-methylase UbiE
MLRIFPSRVTGFDVLICESVNTFVPDLDRAAQEYVRVIKPGGYVGLNEAVWVDAPPEAGSEAMTAITGQENTQFRRMDRHA